MGQERMDKLRGLCDFMSGNSKKKNEPDIVQA